MHAGKDDSKSLSPLRDEWPQCGPARPFLLRCRSRGLHDGLVLEPPLVRRQYYMGIDRSAFGPRTSLSAEQEPGLRDAVVTLLE